MRQRLLKIRRQLRAIEIAKILFEDNGYHTEYLKITERNLKWREKREIRRGKQVSK